MEFEEGKQLFEQALPMARRIATLKQSVKGKVVPGEGFTFRKAARCCNRKLYRERGSVYRIVGDSVAVKASKNHRVQQRLRNRPQQVQYQSVASSKFQQVSISFGTWFGTRGSEVQILSPRPFIFSDLQPSG
jgi:hypothetical protein